jgi:vancomycin resistance protein YoaR
MIFSTKPDQKYKWPIIIFVAIFFILISSLPIFYFAFQIKYYDKIIPGVSAGGTELGGLKKEQTKIIINKKIDDIRENGINFSYEKKNAVLYPLVSSFESGLSYEIITFDAENTMNQVFAYGHRGNFLINIAQWWNAYLNKKQFQIAISVNQDEVKKFLKENFSDFDKPAEDAGLVIKPGSQNVISFDVSAEKYGRTINYEKALSMLTGNLGAMDKRTIPLIAEISNPEILKSDCVNIDAKAQKIIALAPLELTYNDKKWNIDNERLADWLTLQENKEATSSDDKIIVGLDFKKIESFLMDKVSPEVDVPPQDAKFAIKDGKVAEFQTSHDGITLDIVKTFKELEKIISQDEHDAALVVRVTKSELNNSDVNDLGIKEIIGTGHSKFTGSPKNRRHNIQTGADAVNGTLVKPGDEFSLIKTLGEIDQKSGYLPELVIKENKTTPEFGGGLCQIGTTMFRATLASGFPVTMRQNHSYRVSYYEPAGTDATIYDPMPDYRFVNDSPYNILIQSRIEGDDLYFDFWSTEDGRTATTTYPMIYNITKPQPTKIVETLDLKPGEKKCTEHAHNGADAWFDYTVLYSKENPPKAAKEKSTSEITNADYTIKKRFSSHYVPWREVCLLGVDKLSDTTATTTDIKLNE